MESLMKLRLRQENFIVKSNARLFGEWDVKLWKFAWNFLDSVLKPPMIIFLTQQFQICAYARARLILHRSHVCYVITSSAGLGGSVGCAVRLETRRSRVQPPPRSATFFREDWSWNIFLRSFSPFRWFKKGQLSVSGERMCTILDNRLED